MLSWNELGLFGVFRTVKFGFGCFWAFYKLLRRWLNDLWSFFVLFGSSKMIPFDDDKTNKKGKTENEHDCSNVDWTEIETGCLSKADFFVVSSITQFIFHLLSKLVWAILFEVMFGIGISTCVCSFVFLSWFWAWRYSGPEIQRQ